VFITSFTAFKTQYFHSYVAKLYYLKTIYITKDKNIAETSILNRAMRTLKSIYIWIFYLENNGLTDWLIFILFNNHLLRLWIIQWWMVKHNGLERSSNEVYWGIILTFTFRDWKVIKNLSWEGSHSVNVQHKPSGQLWLFPNSVLLKPVQWYSQLCGLCPTVPHKALRYKFIHWILKI
jgi:hypothetical protein